MSHFTDAKKYIAGGVNSPVRAFAGVGGEPVFIRRAKGAWLETEDDRKLIDYVGSWGPMILGHAHSAVLDAVKSAADSGLSFGAPSLIETELARKICDYMPSIQQVRMVNSGTEATMSAIRLARAFTRRDKIIKFEGCYHGHSDSLLIKAGSGSLTLGIPSSPGVPAGLAQDTITLEYNGIAAVKQAFAELGDQIACVIVEPIAGNMNMVPPVNGFLESLRECCSDYGALLILDEVMTGFRVAKGGAQSVYDITPDLTTIGKIVGGGLPAAAFGGKKNIMSILAPDGPVYQAGTLSGNPLAMAAGIATLKEIGKAGFFDSLEEHTKKLIEGLSSIAAESGLPFAYEYMGGMFGFLFTENSPIRHFNQVATADIQRFKKFFHGMLNNGVYFAPSAFEAGFMSAAHGDDEINRTLDAARSVMPTL